MHADAAQSCVGGDGFLNRAGPGHGVTARRRSRRGQFYCDGRSDCRSRARLSSRAKRGISAACGRSSPRSRSRRYARDDDVPPRDDVSSTRRAFVTNSCRTVCNRSLVGRSRRLVERPDRSHSPRSLGARRRDRHIRERRLLRRDGRHRRHRARARAHVLQGHADARRRRDREADKSGRRLSQRRARSTITRATTRCLPSSGFAQGLDVQADAYARSLIDADELARELEVIIQEAKRKADNPGAVATETLYELLHDRHRIRRWRIGREPGPARAHARRARRLLSQLLSSREYRSLDRRRRRSRRGARRGRSARTARCRPGEPSRHPRPDGRGRRRDFAIARWTGDIGQTQLAFGWRTPGTTHPDTPSLDLLAAVLGSGRASRLYRAVRERRLASSMSAYNYTPTEIGVFVVHAETPPASAGDAARAIWDQVRAVRDGDIGELEIERAKRILRVAVRPTARGHGRPGELPRRVGSARRLAHGRTLPRASAHDDARRTRRRSRIVTSIPDNAGVIVYRPESTHR